MKNLINKLSSKKQTSKKLLFTVVVLVEIIALLIASTYCWVETVSTIWISGEGKIDTHNYTNATVNVSGSSAIDLTKYFREAGNGPHGRPVSKTDPVKRRYQFRYG